MGLDRAEAAVVEAARGAPGVVERAVAWCAVNSGSHNLAGLAAMADLLADAFAVLPGTLDRIELTPSQTVGADGEVRAQAHGAALRLTVRPEAPVQAALTGHFDTVYPADTGFTAVRTRADGALNGPGIADMKGGLSVMLAALQAFETHPDAARLGYQVLLSPDEEVGSLASRPLLAALGRRAQVGLTYEPALAGGALAGARKGSGNFHVVVRGRSAHAGRDFAAGRNAVAAAARLAGTLDALNGTRDGLTLNIARIDGGAPLNTVPDLAVLRFNVRLSQPEDAAFVQAEVARAVAELAGDGITAALHGGFTRPPKPFDAAQQALFGAVVAAGADLGLALEHRPSGGVCEGNNLYAAGVPNLDTLGVRGGDIHSEAEHAWPDSFGERAALSALVLGRLATGAIDAGALKQMRSAAMAGAA